MIIGERDGYVNYYPAKSVGVLNEGIRVEDENGVIQVGNNSSPELLDWDNDGDLDLIVAEDDPGNIRLFMNVGNSKSYKFKYIGFVEADGEPIKYKRCQIQIFDLDKDGLEDLLVGNGLAKKEVIRFFKNSGTKTKPEFTFHSKLQFENGEEIIANGDIHFCLGDYDGDGTEDLIFSGYVQPDSTDTKKNPLFIAKGISPVKTEKTIRELKHDVAYIVSTKERVIRFNSNVDIKELYLFNITGKQVRKSNSNFLDINNVPPGVYFLTGKDVNNLRYSKKIEILR